MKAALYPIWRFDAMFEGRDLKVDYETEDKSGKGLVTVSEGYVPGQYFTFTLIVV